MFTRVDDNLQYHMLSTPIAFLRQRRPSCSPTERADVSKAPIWNN